jgi:hypothetical protein
MFRRRPTRMLAATAALTMGIIFTAPVYAQSAADCAARADRAARDSGSAVRGGVGGAAGGAVIGAIASDNSRRGARRGAAAGAVAGGATGAYRNNKTYKRIYDDCMAGR